MMRINDYNLNVLYNHYKTDEKHLAVNIHKQLVPVPLKELVHPKDGFFKTICKTIQLFFKYGPLTLNANSFIEQTIWHRINTLHPDINGKLGTESLHILGVLERLSSDERIPFTEFQRRRLALCREFNPLPVDTVEGVIVAVPLEEEGGEVPARTEVRRTPFEPSYRHVLPEAVRSQLAAAYAFE